MTTERGSEVIAKEPFESGRRLLPLVTKRREGVGGDVMIAVERHSLSVDSVLQGKQSYGDILSSVLVWRPRRALWLRFVP